MWEILNVWKGQGVMADGAALLEYHLRERGGYHAQHGIGNSVVGVTSAPWPLPPAISFNPLFTHPVGQHEELASASQDAASTDARPSQAEETKTELKPEESAESRQRSELPVRAGPSDALTEANKGVQDSSSPSTSLPPATKGSAAAKQANTPTTVRSKQPHAPTRSSPLNPATADSAVNADAITSLAAPGSSSTTAVPSSGSVTLPLLPNDKAKTAEALADLLRQVVDADKLNLAGAKEDSEPLVNEDGLPIHEIRETPDGQTLDGGLVSQGDEIEGTSSGRDLQDEMEEKENTYWSAEAVARRKALYDRVFGGGDDSDSDDDNEEEPDAADDSDDLTVQDRKGKGRDQARSRRARHNDSGESDSEDEGRSALPASIGSRQVNSPPPLSDVDQSIPSPTSPAAASLASRAGTSAQASSSIGLGHGPSSSTSPTPSTSAVRRTSASMPPPAKSILKPPATRKKSVSFDESVPLPPDSPEPPNGRANGKMGFQLPLPIAVGGAETDGFGEKAVPVISAPMPKTKAEQRAGTSGFAGFKRGFLNGSPKSTPARDEAAEGSAIEEKPTRKTSLFAQRMAEKAVVESPSNSAPIPPTPPHSRTKQKPALPKMSESVGTSSVKPAVVEKPPAVRETVKEAGAPEVANWTPLSQLPPNAPSGYQLGESSTSSAQVAKEAEEDDEDYDDDELEFDSEEEDEYDLDDALLAREMALEYHRRKMYQPRKYGSDEEYDEEGGVIGQGDQTDPDSLDLGGMGENGLGNVMLALPQVEGGDGPQIVNPTPDDWRRFVRVGRLENGNLVLAPGQEGWEGEEDGDDEAEGAATNAVTNGQMQAPGPQRTAAPPTDSRAIPSSGIAELSPEDKKANVERMKRVLLGLEEDRPLQQPSVAGPSSEILLPPTLQSASAQQIPSTLSEPVGGGKPISTVGTKGVGDIVERSVKPVTDSVRERETADTATAAPPKKVSRFKAARMGA